MATRRRGRTGSGGRRSLRIVDAPVPIPIFPPEESAPVPIPIFPPEESAPVPTPVLPPQVSVPAPVPMLPDPLEETVDIALSRETRTRRRGRGGRRGRRSLRVVDAPVPIPVLPPEEPQVPILPLQESVDIALSREQFFQPLCIIDLTEETPLNHITPVQLVGPSASSAHIDDVAHLNETIDICTPVKFPTGLNRSPKKRRSEDDSVKVQKKQELCCPICLEDLDFGTQNPKRQVMSTKCGHVFCNLCITSVLKDTKNCPVCRKKQTLKDIHPLFL